MPEEGLEVVGIEFKSIGTKATREELQALGNSAEETAQKIKILEEEQKKLEEQLSHRLENYANYGKSIDKNTAGVIQNKIKYVQSLINKFQDILNTPSLQDKFKDEDWVRKTTQFQLGEVASVKTEFEEVKDNVKNIYTYVDGVQISLRQAKVAAQNFGKEIEGVYKDLKVGDKIGESIISKVDVDDVKGIRKYYAEVIKDGQRIQEVYSQTGDSEKLYRISQKQAKVEEKQRRTWKDQFKDRITRISTYKIISAIFRNIVKLFKEGFQYLNNYSILQDSLSGIKGTFIGISTSIASLLTPAIQVLNSVLQPVSNAFINLANSMAQANAIAQGQSQYYKISASAIDEYTKSLQEANGQLTQLDKFATLQGGKPMLGKMVDITDNPFTDWNKDEINTMSTFIQGLMNKIDGWIETIIGFGKSIWGLIKTVLQSFENLGLKGEDLGKILAGVFVAINAKAALLFTTISSIATLLSGKASAGAKIAAGAFLSLAAAYAAFVVVKKAGETMNPYAAAAVAAGLTATLAAAIGTFSSLSNKSPSTGSVSSLTTTYGYDRLSSSGYYPSNNVDFATQLGDSVANGVSSGLSGRGGVQNVTVPIYIGGSKLTEVTQKIDYYSTKNNSTGYRG